MEPIEFLDAVWRKEIGYVDVPSKIRGHWMPWIGQWPLDRDVIRRRIESCVADEEDVYFSAAMFSGPSRKMADVLPTTWLWADLDKEDPVGLDIEHIVPTIAWESSPGRYQAMWSLGKKLTPKKHSILNRRLSHAIGADPGGWDLTQVLRPVGTTNFKYDPPASVQLLYNNPKIWYHVYEIVDAIYAIEEYKRTGQEPELVRNYREKFDFDFKSLPAQVRRLLATPEEQVVTGERSNVLWKLECMLVEHGLEEDQIFKLTKPTSWNKFDTDEQLLADIRRAILHVGQKQRTAKPTVKPTPVKKEKSPFVGYDQFIGMRLPKTRWLVEGIWTARSQGYVAGEAKVFKTTTALGLGLAVASGRPFLGKFEVKDQGPVILVNEENEPARVQSLLRDYAKLYDLEGRIGKRREDGTRTIEFPPSVPFYLLNNWGFDLSQDEHRKLLETEIRTRDASLVILDPVYTMTGSASLSNQHELGPLLKWLTYIRQKYSCSLMLVHHWGKSSGGEEGVARRSGMRLLGSVIQHGWMESSLYLEHEGYDPTTQETTIRVGREFRAVAPHGPLTVTWRLGPKMQVEVAEHDEGQHYRTLLLECGLSPRRPVTMKAWAEALRTDKTTATKIAKQVEGVEVKSYKRGFAYVSEIHMNGGWDE
jgi:AAA domain/RepB DNA-primase from phage plasmid